MLALELTGAVILNLYKVFRAMVFGRMEFREFLNQSSRLVCNSWQAVFTIMVALGVVIGVQLGPEFDTRGLGAQLGITSALTMTRELGPVIGSLMIATQFGSGMAAELANMKITEQVDALRVFKVNPVVFLVKPRFMAAILFCPVLIWLASLVGIISTFVTVKIVSDIPLVGFMNSIWTYMRVEDIWLCLYKGSAFGAMIVIIASTLGLRTRGGAKEVGRATTLTVILCFIAIVLADFLITSAYL